MDFIGRKNELSILRKAYSNDNYEGIAIYGRRRIGKSELIKESLKGLNCKVVYFQCTRAPEETNATSLSEEIGRVFSIPTPSYKTIPEALDFLFSYSLKNKIVTILDEYPYVRDENFILDSKIQKVIDEYKTRCKMKLILCGSYIDVMEKLLSGNNPLFGRFSYKILIKQMNYYESSAFYKNFSNEDKVRLYSVFGGVPYYNQFINPTLSVEENIIELIASQNARLLPEAENFLNSEIRKMGNANECFNAIAAGNKKFSDILNSSRVSSSPALSDVLKKLINMDAIDKKNPINDETEKKSIYSIKDRLSLFYFTYIFKKASIFRIMPSKAFFEEFIKDDFETKYVPKAFELIAKEYFERMNTEGRIKPTLHKIGTYYYDDPKNKINGEFDVVTLDSNGYCFYECKFTKNPINDEDVSEEENQLTKAKIYGSRLGFISRNGFDLSNTEKYHLLTIDDLYKD